MYNRLRTVQNSIYFLKTCYFYAVYLHKKSFKVNKTWTKSIYYKTEVRLCPFFLFFFKPFVKEILSIRVTIKAIIKKTSPLSENRLINSEGVDKIYLNIRFNFSYIPAKVQMESGFQLCVCVYLLHIVTEMLYFFIEYTNLYSP